MGTWETLVGDLVCEQHVRYAPMHHHLRQTCLSANNLLWTLDPGATADCRDEGLDEGMEAKGWES